MIDSSGSGVLVRSNTTAGMLGFVPHPNRAALL